MSSHNDSVLASVSSLLYCGLFSQWAVHYAVVVFSCEYCFEPTS